MPNNIISIEHLTKKYDLGVIGTGTLTRDLERWWARIRNQPDPYARIGQEDRFKKYGESILALDDVSFTVEQGQTLGIIGRNGSGKSTLLKILSRVTAPTNGVVKVKGRIGSLLEVGTGFHPELTGRENVYLNGAILGMKKEEVARKFDEIVDFSGVEKFIDTPVKRYSSGMYVRLGFAVAAHLDPEILIVDEVLAVGDAEFQKKCLGKMGDVAGEGRTVLFVSHNMASIESLCTKCILITNGKLDIFSDTNLVISEYLANFNNFLLFSEEETHIIYENYETIDKYAILRIELLDENKKPKTRLSTWDKIDIKITYYSKENVKNASVVLKISDKHNRSILLLSTQPDSSITMDLVEGENSLHCVIESIPLSSGIYSLGCGLAIPNKEWLYWNNEITRLKIYPKDVYNSGLSPTESRSLIALQHYWIIDNEEN